MSRIVLNQDNKTINESLTKRELLVPYSNNVDAFELESYLDTSSSYYVSFVRPDNQEGFTYPLELLAEDVDGIGRNRWYLRNGIPQEVLAKASHSRSTVIEYKVENVILSKPNTITQSNRLGVFNTVSDLTTYITTNSITVDKDNDYAVILFDTDGSVLDTIHTNNGTTWVNSLAVELRTVLNSTVDELNLAKGFTGAVEGIDVTTTDLVIDSLNGLTSRVSNVETNKVDNFNTINNVKYPTTNAVETRILSKIKNDINSNPTDPVNAATINAITSYVAQKNAEVAAEFKQVGRILEINHSITDYISGGVLYNTDQSGSGHPDIELVDINGILVSSINLVANNIIQIDRDNFNALGQVSKLQYLGLVEVSPNVFEEQVVNLFDTSLVPLSVPSVDGVGGANGLITSTDKESLDKLIQSGIVNVNGPNGFIQSDGNGNLDFTGLNLASYHKRAGTFTQLTELDTLASTLTEGDAGAIYTYLGTTEVLFKNDANTRSFLLEEGEGVEWTGDISNPGTVDGWHKIRAVENVTGIKFNGGSLEPKGDVDITTTKLGLGNVTNTSDADKVSNGPIKDALDLKVDTVVGNGLRTDIDTNRGDIDNLLDGTVASNKAINDADGNNIVSTYSTKTERVNSFNDLAGASRTVENIYDNAQEAIRLDNVKIDKANIETSNIANVDANTIPSTPLVKSELDNKADIETVDGISGLITQPALSFNGNIVTVGAHKEQFKITAGDIRIIDVPELTITVDPSLGFESFIQSTINPIDNVVSLESSSTFPAPAVRRIKNTVAVARHYDKIAINSVVNGGFVVNQAVYHAWDRFDPEVVVKRGLNYSGNSGTETFAISSGTIFGPGISKTVNNENLVTLSAEGTIEFGLVYRDGAGGLEFLQGNFTSFEDIPGWSNNSIPVDDNSGTVQWDSSGNNAFVYKFYTTIENPSEGVVVLKHFLLLPHTDIQGSSGYSDRDNALDAITRGDALYTSEINLLSGTFILDREFVVISTNADDYGDDSSVSFRRSNAVGVIAAGVGLTTTDDVDNMSSVAGSSVTQALDTLKGYSDILEEVKTERVAIANESVISINDGRNLLANNIPVRVELNGIGLRPNEYTYDAAAKTITLAEVITQEDVELNFNIVTIYSGNRKG